MFPSALAVPLLAVMNTISVRCSLFARAAPHQNLQLNGTWCQNGKRSDIARQLNALKFGTCDGYGVCVTSSWMLRIPAGALTCFLLRGLLARVCVRQVAALMMVCSTYMSPHDGCFSTCPRILAWNPTMQSLHYISSALALVTRRLASNGPRTIVSLTAGFGCPNG